MRLKKFINLRRIMRKGKAIFLAYDQGVEHGPTDFNDKNVNPKYIIDIAKKGRYTGLILQKGVAEMYYKDIKKSKVPLILKLNGKTSLYKGEPYSTQLATVEEAVLLGAKAVGYTVYIGSEYESKMLSQLEEIQRKAHDAGLPVIAWIYPRGKSVKSRSKAELMAYSARVALETGVDIVKIQAVGKQKDLEWAVRSAGKVKVVVAGGPKKSESRLLDDIRSYVDAGFVGVAIGRNVWKNKDPLEITRKIKKVIWKK